MKKESNEDLQNARGNTTNELKKNLNKKQYI